MDELHDKQPENQSPSDASNDRLAGSRFEKEANKPNITLWQEFCYLIVHERQWWLVPILLTLGLIAVAVFFSSSAAMPFIYTLF
jgi:hypothetical protein